MELSRTAEVKPQEVTVYQRFFTVNPVRSLIVDYLSNAVKEIEGAPHQVSAQGNSGNLFSLVLTNTHDNQLVIDRPEDDKQKDKDLKEQLVRYKQQQKGFQADLDICIPGTRLGTPQYLAFKGFYESYNYLINNGFPSSPDRGFAPRHIAMLLDHDFVERDFSDPNYALCTSKIELCGVMVELVDLHFAIIKGNARQISSIFIIDSNVSSEVPQLGNVLHLAILFRQGHLVPILLQQQFRYNKSVKQLLNELDKFGGLTPLALAGVLNDIDTVDYILRLLTEDISLPANSDILADAFHHSALAHHNDVVKLFFFYGFNPLTAPNYTTTISELATKRFHDTINIITQLANRSNRGRSNKPKPLTQIYSNLVFSGGGMKGAIYPYALKALDKATKSRITFGQNKHNLQDDVARRLGIGSVKRALGISAGSIFALGFVLQPDIDELIKVTKYDFGKFLDTPELRSLSANAPAAEMTLQECFTQWRQNGDQTLVKEIIDSSEKLFTAYNNMGSFSLRDIAVRWHLNDMAAFVTNARLLSSKLPELYKEIQKIDQEFKGLSEGKAIHDWLFQFMQQQGIADPEHFTFGDLARCVKANPARYRHLYVTVMCLDTGIPLTLSSESHLDNNPFADYVILYAVEASLAIPFVLTPKKLCLLTPNKQQSWTSQRFVDGGVLRNSGITEFDQKRFTNASAISDDFFMVRNLETLGFKFGEVTFEPLTNCFTLRDFATRLAKIYYAAEAIINKYEDHEYGRMIALDTGNIQTLPFKEITPEERNMLQKNANRSVKKYFFPNEKDFAQTMCQLRSPLFKPKEDSWESDDEEDSSFTQSQSGVATGTREGPHSNLETAPATTEKKF